MYQSDRATLPAAAALLGIGLLSACTPPTSYYLILHGGYGSGES